VRKSIIVLFHGYIRPSKGILELIEAIKILNKRNWHINKNARFLVLSIL